MKCDYSIVQINDDVKSLSNFMKACLLTYKIRLDDILKKQSNNDCIELYNNIVENVKNIEKKLIIK